MISRESFDKFPTYEGNKLLDENPFKYVVNQCSIVRCAKLRSFTDKLLLQVLNDQSNIK